MALRKKDRDGEREWERERKREIMGERGVRRRRSWIEHFSARQIGGGKLFFVSGFLSWGGRLFNSNWGDWGNRRISVNYDSGGE